MNILKQCIYITPQYDEFMNICIAVSYSNWFSWFVPNMLSVNFQHHFLQRVIRCWALIYKTNTSFHFMMVSPRRILTSCWCYDET